MYSKHQGRVIFLKSFPSANPPTPPPLVGIAPTSDFTRSLHCQGQNETQPAVCWLLSGSGSKQVTSERERCSRNPATRRGGRPGLRSGDAQPPAARPSRTVPTNPPCSGRSRGPERRREWWVGANPGRPGQPQAACPHPRPRPTPTPPSSDGVSSSPSGFCNISSRKCLVITSRVTLASLKQQQHLGPQETCSDSPPPANSSEDPSLPFRFARRWPTGAGPGPETSDVGASEWGLRGRALPAAGTSTRTPPRTDRASTQRPSGSALSPDPWSVTGSVHTPRGSQKLGTPGLGGVRKHRALTEK